MLYSACTCLEIVSELTLACGNNSTSFPKVIGDVKGCSLVKSSTYPEMKIAFPVPLSELCLTDTPEVLKIIKRNQSNTRDLDSLPTGVLKETLEVHLLHQVEIINASFTSETFPEELNTALVRPLLEKPALSKDIYKNYQPVSNLAFIGTVTEKVVSSRLLPTCRSMALRKNISELTNSFTLQREHSSRSTTTLLGALGPSHQMDTKFKLLVW